MSSESLIRVSGNKRFFCANGQVFASVEELADGLRFVDDDVFSSHVNSEKNDFANWIYDVIGDVKLADSLRKLKDKNKIKKKIMLSVSKAKKSGKKIVKKKKVVNKKSVKKKISKKGINKRSS